MTIIHSCCSKSWGGLEITALETADILRRRGHNISVMCSASSILEKKAKDNNLQTAAVYKSKGWIDMMKSIRKAAAVLKSGYYDLVHSHMPHDLWTLVPALILAGKSKETRLILSIHLASGIRKNDLFHRFLYKRVEKIITLSEFLKRNILRTYPVEEDKIAVIPTALRLTEYDGSLYDGKSMRQELGIEQNCITAGIVGRLTHGKGHREFLIAAKRVKDKLNQPVKFIVAGKADRGEEHIEEKLKQLCSELNLENDIIFAGFREDIPRLFTAIDVLAFPSHDEAFGRTIVEAMAMRVPVVASNRSAIVEIVVNGKTGILVPPENPDALANALIGLLENRELRERYGEEGRKRVLEKFDADVTFKEIESIYQERDPAFRFHGNDKKRI